MVNEASYKIVGIGSIIIKMFDGVVRILTKLRNVLDLRRSFISLGKLDFGGYKYTGHERVLKVSKGTLVVIKTLNKGNLYILVGSIDISHAAILSKTTEDPAQLWHQRLRHMSERGLKLLMNCKLLPNL